MSLTTFDRIFQLERTEVAFIPKKGPAPVPGKYEKLYIPRLMPNIKMGDPTTFAIPTRGTSVFKNAPACAIKVDPVMTGANFIEVKFEGNTKWTASKAKINEETGERKVEKGLRVVCHADSNVVGDMTFSNM